MSDVRQWQWPKNEANKVIGWRSDGKGLENRVSGTGDGDMLADNNLSDLDDKEAARSRLGVFSSAVVASAAAVPVELTSIETEGYGIPGDGGGALYKKVASEPSHAGKLQTADGAWWEIVPTDGRLNICQFGSKAGASEPGQHVAIQSAIDTVNALGGGELVVPIGVFMLDKSGGGTGGQIDAKSNVSITGGRGSELRLAATAGARPLLGGSGVSDFSITGVTLTGPGWSVPGGTNETGVYLLDPNRCKVARCTVAGFAYDGVLFVNSGAGVCRDNEIIENHVSNCGDDGINIGGNGNAVVDTRVHGNVLRGMGNVGIHVSDGARRTSVIGNSVATCGTRGIDNVLGGDELTMMGNTVDDCPLGIVIEGDILGATVSGNTVRSATSCAIRVSQAATSVIVSGNIVLGGVEGINVGDTASDVTVSTNQVRGTSSHGISLLGESVRCDVLDNHVRLAGGVGIRGSYVENAVRHHKISDNRIFSASSESILMFNASNSWITENYCHSTGHAFNAITESGSSANSFIRRNYVDKAILASSSTVSDNDGPGA